MSKITANISIEAETWELAKSKYPQQLSSLVEDFLKTLLYTDTPLQPAQNIEQDTKETIENISKLRIRLQDLDVQKLKQIQEAKLQAAQKQEESRKKHICINCGNPIITKDIQRYSTPKGSICKSCFFNASKEQIREWSLNG